MYIYLEIYFWRIVIFFCVIFTPSSYLLSLKDHKGQVCYIATQHPMTETVRDFWQMVWDQRVQTVVMVNDEEKEKTVRLIVTDKES